MENPQIDKDIPVTVRCKQRGGSLSLIREPRYWISSSSMIADYNTYIGLGDEDLGVERNKVSCGLELPLYISTAGTKPSILGMFRAAW